MQDSRWREDPQIFGQQQNMRIVLRDKKKLLDKQKLQ